MPNIDEKYKAAHESHKHYDNLSVATVSGMILSVGATFSIADKVDNELIPKLIFLASIGILLSLFYMYKSFSESANIARLVAAEIELKGDQSEAISTVYSDEKKSDQYLENRKNKKGRVYKAVRVLTLFLSACMVIAAFLY